MIDILLVIIIFLLSISVIGQRWEVRKKNQEVKKLKKKIKRLEDMIEVRDKAADVLIKGLLSLDKEVKLLKHQRNLLLKEINPSLN